MSRNFGIFFSYFYLKWLRIFIWNGLDFFWNFSDFSWNFPSRLRFFKKIANLKKIEKFEVDYDFSIFLKLLRFCKISPIFLKVLRFLVCYEISQIFQIGLGFWGFFEIAQNFWKNWFLEFLEISQIFLKCLGFWNFLLRFYWNFSRFLDFY